MSIVTKIISFYPEIFLICIVNVYCICYFIYNIKRLYYIEVGRKLQVI